MSEEGFIDYKKYIPLVDKPIEVMTKFGLRKAIFDRIRGFYRFTDCTHPMQNCYCNTEEIQGWRYESAADNEALLIQPNHYAREKEGEEILKSVCFPKQNSIFLRANILWNHIAFLYLFIFRFTK